MVVLIINDQNSLTTLKSLGLFQKIYIYSNIQC